MTSGIDFNLLISNVICERRFSHCRLCLKSIEDASYVKFEDSVAGAAVDFQPLSDILTELLGSSVCEDLPAVEAVCVDCVDMVLKSHNFLTQCRNSTQHLHRILDNLCATLDIDVDDKNKDKDLFIMIKGGVSKAVFLDNIVDSSANDNSAQKHHCDQCNESFQTRKTLVKHHMDNHSASGKSKSNEVEEFKSPKSIKTPEAPKKLSPHQNNENNIYICKSCAKPYNNLKKLQVHESKHELPQLRCPKCKKTYITKDSYRKHVNLCLENLIEEHPFRKINKVYCCSECDKGYGTPGGLRVHQRFVHQNAQPHVCPFCNKAFTAPSYLKTHIIKHTGEKNFECQICKKLFVSKDALVYHVRRHNGEKPYTCRLCNEKFVNASARAEHIKFKHNDPTFTCSICCKKFYTMNFLRQHMNRHHDPSSKLYAERNLLPPNMPGEQNKRIKITNDVLFTVGVLE